MFEESSELVLLLARGGELRDKGELESSAAAYQEIVERFPDFAEGHYRLGTAMSRLNRIAEAEQCYRKALLLRPEYPEAANNLGAIMVGKLAYQEAELLYRQALLEKIDFFDAHINLANLLADLNRLVEALYYAKRGLALQPQSPIALECLGQLYRRQGKYESAIALLEQAVEVDDNYIPVLGNLGVCYLQSGQHLAAEATYKKALSKAPAYPLVWNSLLLLSNYLGREREEVFSLHKSYGKIISEKVSRKLHGNLIDPGRRLRIGFVSGDLRRHSVSYFVWGVLSKLDRNQFELWAYYNFPTEDPRAYDFKQLFYRWRNVYGTKDSEVAEQICQDRIDILIDLSGHTGHNRLRVFAEKPAPVQVSWIGYPNTTGLESVDYRLTDSYADPIGNNDSFYTEKLWRLPRSFLCYSPPPNVTPPVVPPPSLERGYITFGSFNTRVKLVPECIALWSQVLKAVPNSRMLIKSAMGFEELSAREAMRAEFAKYDVDADRICVQGAKNAPEEHFAMYSEIDIALDTYPYHGTTTTCESLWMGVPVVTLAGDRHVSRVGVSLLSNAGLEDLIASDKDEYVEIACRLAENVESLSTIRRILRDFLKSSRLLDESAMADDVSKAFRNMWEIHCQSRSEEDNTSSCKTTAPTTEERLPERLVIGYDKPREGWKIFSTLEGEQIDFAGNLFELSRFPDEVFDEVYCVHVVQRFAQADILEYFKGLHRIIKPSGKLYLSIPDIDVLAWLFCSPQYAKADKFQLMRFMFGSQATTDDFNQVGLNVDFVRDYLREAGFSTVDHVKSFGLFDDASETYIDGIMISLNLIVGK